MTLLSVILLISALIFLVVTRITYVYLSFGNGLTIEFHFVIFSLKLGIKGEGSSPSIGALPSIVSRLRGLSRRSEIRVMRISFGSYDTERFERRFPFPYGAFALSGLFLAYFKANSKRITFEENSITLSHLKEGAAVELRLYTELYNILICLIGIGVALLKHRKTRKRKYVRN